MIINNKKTINSKTCMIVIVLFMDILLFVIFHKIYKINNIALYGGCPLLLLVLIWRISQLRIIWLEISEQMISVKNSSPVWCRKKIIPVHKIPLEKIITYKIEKAFMNYFLILTVHGKNGIKNFYYGLGFLSKSQLDELVKYFEQINIERE